MIMDIMQFRLTALNTCGRDCLVVRPTLSVADCPPPTVSRLVVGIPWLEGRFAFGFSLVSRLLPAANL